MIWGKSDYHQRLQEFSNNLRGKVIINKIAATYKLNKQIENIRPRSQKIPKKYIQIQLSDDLAYEIEILQIQ